MTNAYLQRNATTGRIEEVIPAVTGGTGSEAGQLTALDGTGRLSPTVMPVGVSADTYSGVTSEALTAGDFVYISSIGEVAKASAASGGFDADGFVLTSYTLGQTAIVYLEGRNTALTGLTAGTRYYLSASTPGVATATPVTGIGKRHQFLGRALGSTSLSFEADDSITLAQ